MDEFYCAKQGQDTIWRYQNTTLANSLASRCIAELVVAANVEHASSGPLSCRCK